MSCLIFRKRGDGVVSICFYLSLIFFNRSQLASAISQLPALYSLLSCAGNLGYNPL